MLTRQLANTVSQLTDGTTHTLRRQMQTFMGFHIVCIRHVLLTQSERGRRRLSADLLTSVRLELLVT